MRHRVKNRRTLRTETLEIRRCLAASLGWDGPGQGSADLSYYIGPAPAGLSQAAVESAIETALQAWSDVIDVDFTQTSQRNQLDSIDFSFRSIDGSGGTLAQAYFPDDVNPARIAGDVQFDSSERWEIGNALGRSAFDLAWVAVHEIGHSLGIDHLNISGSVMAPFVSPSEQFTSLRTADIDAALTLYGAATTSLTPVETPAETEETGTTTDDPATQPDPADNNTPDTNRNWRPWRGFWWWRARWRSGSRVSAAPEQLVAAPQQHNAVMPADVNQDGDVTSRDALAIINQLVRHEGAEGESTMLADTNADGTVTAGDALFVINEVARMNAGSAATADVIDGLDSIAIEETEAGNDEVMGDSAVETETEVDETEADQTDTDDTPLNEVTVDDTSPVNDTTPVEEPNTVDDTTPTDDTPPVDGPPAVDDTTPVDDPNTVDDTTPTDDTPPVDGPPAVEDTTPVDDPNSVDDTQPVDDATPSDETPPVEDTPTTDEQDQEHCPGFGRPSIGFAVERLFTILDTNDDGALTSDEIPASLLEAMAPIDTNDDGAITLEEIQDSRPDHGSRGFGFLDDNGDGLVTEDEVNADIWERISPADTDTDGAVTEQELTTYRDSLPPKGFRRLDDDGDGLITQDEVNEMIWMILVGSDTNDDSAISPEEFPEFNLFGHHRGRFGGFRGVHFGFHFG